MAKRTNNELQKHYTKKCNVNNFTNAVLYALSYLLNTSSHIVNCGYKL